MLSNSLFTPVSQNHAALGNLPETKFVATASVATNKQRAEFIFTELRSQGLKDRDIVSISSELLSRLTSEIQTRSQVKNGDSV
jgi:hypothetical protein